jgi:lipopolysaccharide/colanic/teichoic acid biosynthesis glycosyltransferase
MSTIATDCFRHLGPHNAAWALKRMVDVILATVSLVVMLPLLVVLALLIFLDDPGPIFYISERIGKDGRAFPCFKFRTMVKGADSIKVRFAA